jgi:hypothetical protein
MKTEITDLGEIEMELKDFRILKADNNVLILNEMGVQNGNNNNETESH